MANTIYAAFTDPGQAEKAAGALLDHGVRPEDLSVVRSHSGELEVTTSQGVVGSGSGYPDVITDTSGDVETSAKQGISTTTAADAGAGAVKGTAWGAGLGALAVLASLIVPGVGLVLGGGALAAALGAVAASAGAGAVAGAVTGYLKDQGVDEHVAHHYESTIGAGGALLAITLPSGEVGEEEARGVIEKYGATQVNAYSSQSYLA